MLHSQFLKQRYNKVTSNLAQNALLVLFSSLDLEEYGSPIVASDFSYLSDYWDSGAIFVLTADGLTALFTDLLKPNVARWHGAIDIINQQLNYDILGDLAKAKTWLSAILPNYSDIYTNFAINCHASPHPWLLDLLTNVNSQQTLHDTKDLLANLRVIKDQEELNRMQEAARLGHDALNHAMTCMNLRDYEFQIAADFRYWLNLHDSIESFPTIIAQGDNGGVMHYHTLKKRLVNGELILMDVGSRWRGYCSDISRTVPYVSPLTTQQQEVYNWVKKIQHAVISSIKPGVSWHKLQSIADYHSAEALRELGILHQSLESILENKIFKTYTVHSIGHWLGIDVHDVGDYKLTLEPNMVLTVEPGLYLTSCGVKAFEGINIRLEDDVVVTDNASRLLY